MTFKSVSFLIMSWRNKRKVCPKGKTSLTEAQTLTHVLDEEASVCGERWNGRAA